MYAELIIGINMLFNYAILSFANKVGNVQAPRSRLIVAALLGSIPVTIFQSSIIVLILSFFGMTLCAFGKAFEPWRKSATMVIIGAVFAGGLLTVFQFRVQTFNSAVTILTYAIIAYLSLHYMKKKWLDVRITQQLSSLHSSSILRVWGSNVQVNVFVDSGNSCTEPLSGAPVHFVSLKAVEKSIPENLRKPLLNWTPKGAASLSDFPEEYQKNMRLIRLVTVQGKSWAIGFKYEQWTLEHGIVLRPGYIVLTENDRRYPDGAEAILHVSAIESMTGFGKNPLPQ
ncbi:sigma-E processing peptidase SpoIIGA [Sporosarcina sp. HYO08]|uniref:sigma-E processing peptidase SpoIIGA n=1 Tax=Sporosarcina sp. HYO08 TaxID=1759557 RepID=UPI00079B6383|nr:sigma-E processing peptidase SpoIIGA [Sporosarcina sp. HYO08]KXH79906.1 hypothetical protein AU377_10540 [Sporosarcina sp. HYO08]